MADNLERKFNLNEFKAISRAISSYQDVNLLMSHISQGLQRTFGFKGCCIMLFDDREKQLFRVSCFGISDDFIEKGPVFLNESEDFLKNGKPVIIKDIKNDSRVQYPKETAKEDIVSILSVPIKCREDVIGILRIYHNQKICIHDDDIDSINVLAKQLGVVSENNGLRNFLDEVKSSLSSLPLRMLEGLK